MAITLPPWHRLSNKIVGLLLGFLILALGAIGITLLLSWQLEGSGAAINEAGSLRMHGYRLEAFLSRSAGSPGQQATKSAIEQEILAIDKTFVLLQRGDPQRPLILPATQTIQTTFQQVSGNWRLKLRPLAKALQQQGGSADEQTWQRYQHQVDDFVAEVNRFVHLIEIDSEQRTFWLRSSQLALVAMALIGTTTLIYLMFMLIIEPITLLEKGMRRMAEKDFEVRLAVESDDEFGQLTRGFNQMADRLEALYGNLEERVREKTGALENQNRELALLYDSAAFLQRPQQVEATCAGFLQRIMEYFQADGGSVRILDGKRGNLHMVAHAGISEHLVDSEHCLKMGECLCGAAAAHKLTVVHDLRQMDETNTMQCHREGFVTVSVFHIHAHEQHLGFFNLHFRQPKIFDRREVALLETLGQLLGIAIENMRLANREREMAVSEERNLVAQGLHDSIAQGLTFLNLQVQMLDDSLQNGNLDEAAEIVPALQAGVQESYDDVRELLVNFRSRLAEGDLIASLENTVAKFERQTGIATEFIADADGAPFPREQQLQVLFIVQEALSNIRKHAMATKVEIRLTDRHHFALTIHDNGVGFDAAILRSQSERHVGLNIMHERAQRIHASLAVTSETGNGATVTLNLPYEQRLAA
jgi:two-component system nitrate/nitrite sensor histidine kinase NarX